MGINRSVPGIKNSVQNDVNWSFDEDFGVLAVELLSHNPVTDTLERVTTVQGNASLTMSNADAVVASTKTLTMTIGATSYVSTLSYNASGDFLSMSVWSEV